MISGIWKLLLAASPAKASFVSALVHMVGLGLLGAALLNFDLEDRRAPAGSVVIQMQVEETEDIDSEFYVAEREMVESRVVVMPDRALVAERWYRQVPTTITLPDTEPAGTPEPVVSEPVAVEKPVPPVQEDVVAVATQTESILRKLPPRQPTAVSRVAIPPEPTAGYGDAPPQFTYQPSPVYPPSARARGWDGTVMVRLQIDLAGQVTSAEVLRSSGHPMLDAAAITTIRTWRCVPRTRGGQPVASTETISIHFRLQ